MDSITPKKVSPRSFGRFGRVVSGPANAPTSQGPEYKFWSDIAHYVIDGETEIGLCTVYRQPRTTLGTVERHLRTPEILVPIDGPFVLPLVREEREGRGGSFPGGSGRGRGDRYRRLARPLPPGRAGTEESYFVIFRRRTPQEDVEKKQIAPVHIA